MNNNSLSCLSVVNANYNNAGYLSRCLNSTLTSDYSNLEVIIVDDGRTDNSKLILEEHRAELEKRCKGNLKIIFLDKNIGSGRAKADALNYVTGD